MVNTLQMRKSGINEKLGFIFNVDTYESGYSDGRLCDPLDPELEAVDQSRAAVCVHGTVLMENITLKHCYCNNKNIPRTILRIK